MKRRSNISIHSNNISPTPANPTESAAPARRTAVLLLVLAVSFLIHLFMFRDVLADLPDLLSGRSAIVRDELVPFYDFQNQFWSQMLGEVSQLTSTDEIRVAYSFWTAWVRYYRFLPFALVVVNSLSLFGLFYSFYLVVSRYRKSAGPFVTAVCFATALFLHLILLYPKITHFYTLVFGFSMFALAISYTILQLFYDDRIKYSRIIPASLLVLLNPAIHYHILFYFVGALLLCLQLAFAYLYDRQNLRAHFRRNAIAFTAITLLSAVPYFLFIYVIISKISSSVSSSIPVNFWMIYYASSGLPSLLSLDTAAQIDMFNYGNYLVETPRYLKFTVTILVFVPLFLTIRSRHKNKSLYFSSLIILLLSLWMSIGYATAFSFHSLAQGLVTVLQERQDLVSQYLKKLLSVFIQILRFPHRFNFIQFYFIGLLASLALIQLKERMAQGGKRLALFAATAAAVFAVPLLAQPDYRKSFLSGDFNTYLATYPVPEDLRQIRSKLEETAQNKVFILPTFESGREAVSGDVRYTFIDKFVIYYLNQPTYYYGAGAKAKNKILSFLAYRSISYREQWWEDIVINNLGITHVLFPKKLQARPQGITYMKDIDPAVAEALRSSERFELAYAGQEFDLYAVKQHELAGRTSVHLPWDKLLKLLNTDRSLEGTRLFFPLQSEEFLEDPAPENTVITDNPERAYYDLYTGSHERSNHNPDVSLLPFSNAFTPSSFYTNNAFLMLNLYAAGNRNNYFQAAIPGLMNLRNADFVGFRGSQRKLNIPFSVEEEDTYRLLLKAASHQQTLTASLGATTVELRQLPKGTGNNVLDFNYFTADIELAPGSYLLNVPGIDDETLLVESLSLLPEEDLPRVSNAGLESRLITLAPDGEQKYRITFRAEPEDK